MAIYLKSICNSSYLKIPGLCLSRNLPLFSVRRSQLFYSQISAYHFSSFSEKLLRQIYRLKLYAHEDSARGREIRKGLEMVAGTKVLNAEEKEKALINHQKLWAAHALVFNFAEVRRHYEISYVIQLLKEPKDFSTYQYYSNLLENKKPVELTPEELREIVDLYQFALAENENPVAAFLLKIQLQKYQGLPS